MFPDTIEMELTEIAFLIGRLILGGYFAFNGIMHFVQFKKMAQYAASKNIPLPRIAIFFASLLILFGGLGIIFGVYVTFAIYLLIIFMIPVTLAVHAFWKISDSYERTVARVQFLKNVALLGAIVMLLLIPTPWPLSLM